MCDLRLPHQAVSSVHAMIVLEDDRYFLVDPGSTNGTTLGGEVLVVERRKLLRSGDVIGIAGFELEFGAGVAMVSSHCQDRTAMVARQLAQHLMPDDGQQLKSPALVTMAGPQAGQRFELSASGARLTVGRSEDNDFVLDDREASRRHLELEVGPEGVVVHDVGGKNLLMINDRPVERQRLKDRDELLVGATRLVFDEPVEAYLRELSQLPDAELPPEPSPEPPEPSPESPESAPPSANQEPPVEEDGPAESADGRREPGETQPEPLRAVRDEVLRRASHVGISGGSTGTEVAILFVGAVVLAICVALLVWIFR